MDDSQDYEKIKIKGPANILKRLDVISTIQLDGGDTKGLNFIMDTDTYGFTFPECVVGIVLPDGINSITESSTDNYETRNVFSTFPKLHNIVIPKSVIEIGYKAFAYSTGLTSIIIPSSVILFVIKLSKVVQV